MSTKKEIYFNGYFYDVTNWIPKHPGGSLINFYTESGEDSSLAILQFHYRAEKKVEAIMKSLPKRAPTNDDVLPKEQSEHYKSLTTDFVQLHKEFEKEGLFKPSISHVVFRFAEQLVLFIVGYLLLRHFRPIGVLLIAICSGRAGWIQHENGHKSFTGKKPIENFLQSFCLGFGMGLSGNYWNSQHNRHHANPQRLNRDVDLETLPLLAFNKKAIRDEKSGKSLFVKNQAILFFVIDSLLIGLLWKYFLHPKYAIKKRKYLDMFFMLLNNVFIFYVLKFSVIEYFMFVWISTNYLLINFSLNHTHLPVTEEPKHWVEYSLLHTANVEQSLLVDWWMGYLNFQIEHHLFPTMPQFRHQLIAPRVKKFANVHNLPYIINSYSGALKLVYNNLKNVSEEFKN